MPRPLLCPDPCSERIIPDDIGIPSSGRLALSGRVYATNFASKEF
jgi:hypothetical protein